MKRKIFAILSLLLALVMLFCACAAHGETLIWAGSEEISVNLFQLYLSRMKGSLHGAGHDVGNPDYWASYISTDNTTTADYYTKQVFDGLRHIAAAMIIYEELGLALPDTVIDAIDEEIEALIEKDGAGSEATLNSILANYGANVTVFRDACILEAKLAQLKEHFYGAGGVLINDTALEEYYQATYYRGYQMQLANYYYEHERDVNKIAVRYTDDKYKTVKYMSEAEIEKAVAGIEDETERAAERAKYVKVAREGDYATKYPNAAYGAELLLYRDGETEIVAYSPSGVINYTLEDGKKKQVEYTEVEMQARYEQATKIAAQCAGDEQKFLQAIADFSDNSEFNTKYAPNGMYFSVDSYATDSIFGSFSAELVKMEIGATKVMATDSGYYIIMRVSLDTGAWQNEANSRWFSNLRAMTLEYMLQQRTEKYLDRVTFNEALLATVDITSVGTNLRY